MAETADTNENTAPPQERLVGDTTLGVAGSESGRSFVLNTKPLFKLMVEKKASDLFFSSN
jgi:hypothetical protein